MQWRAQGGGAGGNVLGRCVRSEAGVRLNGPLGYEAGSKWYGARLEDVLHYMRLSLPAYGTQPNKGHHLAGAAVDAGIALHAATVLCGIDYM
jgi:hypothetical protein